MNWTSLIFALLTVLPVAAAEPADSEHDPMAAISWLVGEWRGSGWTMLGPGERHEFQGTESVESRLDGELLIIEGRHHAPDDPSQVVHNAVAVVSYNQARRNYSFQAKTTGRPGINATGEIDEGVFTWTIQIPSGNIRYRIRQTENGHWHETGERELADGKWVQFFEMTMKRRK